ncbi:MAG: tryptophan--tRNA ligase [Oscillospiraceae bacterium]|jgi:tryptophanyl-tRNA synthetase|nr:tryptophan--tRNA ligase [Oscillospiraceae bacterium]
MDPQKTVFSGIQPTAAPHIGNYLGALKNYVELSKIYRCVYSVVDLHSITVRQDPEGLRRRVRELYALLLACGPEPRNTVLYVQSHVPAHAELCWILNNFTMFGELSRMTQFKDKSAKHADNINAGLFTYPVLQAADIVLYGADIVPIGEDQKQHLELARDIAIRFNGVYGEILTVPEPLIPKLGGRIMSLADPSHKMDKSDPNPAGVLSMLDDRDAIIKKCKRAVTDSGAEVRYDPVEKPGVSNLMTIYGLCVGKDMQAVEKEFAGQGYGAFKTAVGEAADSVLSPIRAKAAEYIQTPAHLDKLMAEEAGRAEAIAEPVLRRVRDAIGFLPRK